MSPLSLPKSPAAATVVLVVLLLAATPIFAAASSNSKSVPPACLRAASSLCMGSSTNAMTCLKKLAKAGDSRVSQACTSALAEGAEQATSKSTPVTRAQALRRMLTEGPGCTSFTDVTQMDMVQADQAQANGSGCAGACCRSPNDNACCSFYMNVVTVCKGSARC